MTKKLPESSELVERYASAEVRGSNPRPVASKEESDDE